MNELFWVDEVQFVRVTERDLPMLIEWMARPHWREWWGDPEIEAGYIRDMIEGRDSTHPYIFHIDTEPAGYIQMWYIGPHQTEEWARDNRWLMQLPASAVGVDLSIAASDQLSKGLGARVLKCFCRYLAKEGHETIIIDPDPANLRAIRAYSKAGFRPVPHLEGAFEDVLIMQFHSDSHDT